MAFEEFQKPLITISKEPKLHVTINDKGRIKFHSFVLREFQLESARFVKLFYDKEQKKMGFKFYISPPDENVFELKYHKNSGIHFYSSLFLRHCNFIIPSLSIRLPIAKEDKNFYTVELPTFKKTKFVKKGN
jgi:hypothetical protein